MLGAFVRLTEAPWCSVFHHLTEKIDDRNVHHTDQREDRAGLVGPARVVYRRLQGDEADIQEEQDQLGCQACVPDPPGAPHRLAPQRAGPQRQEGEKGAGRRQRGGHHSRQARVESQTGASPKGHHQVDEHRHPGRGHMQEDDSIALALLRVGRREQEADAQSGDAENRGQRPEPRDQLAGKRVEGLRAGVSEPVDHSVTHRWLPGIIPGRSSGPRQSATAQKTRRRAPGRRAATNGPAGQAR